MKRTANATHKPAGNMAVTDESSSVERIDKLLNDRTGEFVPLPIDEQHVGGELVSILSKGLYTNPLDALREYVQNSVDAHAHNVTIKLTGNSLTILDDGDGMEFRALLQARQFAVSPKSLTEHVGFRGIGIYSGFDLCERLRITTQRLGEPVTHVLAFDFGKMKELLDAERLQPAGSSRTSLLTLLSSHTFIRREPAIRKDRKFTLVELQGLTDSHVKTLANREGLRRYLLQSLPIDFDEGFEFREQINEQLTEHVPGYNAIAITLQSDGQDDEKVVRPPMPTLQAPKFALIPESGKRVAFVWSSLTAKNERIEEPLDESGKRSEVSGFVYKSKGFTIGNRDRLRTMFANRPQLYPWYTGEVYVLDSGVIPNAARNDFETNPAKTALELAVTDHFDKLEKEAVAYQQASVADRRLEAFDEEVGDIENRALSNTSATALDDYAAVMKIKNAFVRQAKLVSPKYRRRASLLSKRIDTCLITLRETIGSASSEPEKKKAAARNPKVTKRTPVPTPKEAKPKPPRTLYDIFAENDLRFKGVAARVLNAIDEALADALTVGSEPYDRTIAAIEMRLADEVFEDTSDSQNS